jgi:hypothetical protein
MQTWNPFQIYQFRFDDQGWLQYCLIPKKLETCPCCQSQLELEEIGGYYFDETYQVWLCDEIKVDCVRGMKCFKEFKDSEFWRMPYVYWLPIETSCTNWIQRMLNLCWNYTNSAKMARKKWSIKTSFYKFRFICKINLRNLNLTHSKKQTHNSQTYPKIPTIIVFH